MIMRGWVSHTPNKKRDRFLTSVAHASLLLTHFHPLGGLAELGGRRQLGVPAGGGVHAVKKEVFDASDPPLVATHLTHKRPPDGQALEAVAKV